jgi:hypothetical protein
MGVFFSFYLILLWVAYLMSSINGKDTGKITTYFLPNPAYAHSFGPNTYPQRGCRPT